MLRRPVRYWAGLRAGWRTPAVESAIPCLANAPFSRIKFTNIWPFAGRARFLHRENLRPEFGKIGFLAFALLFRLQSEGPPNMVRALPNDLLRPTTPSITKSVLGVVAIHNEELLVLKRASRILKISPLKAQIGTPKGGNINLSAYDYNSL